MKKIFFAVIIMTIACFSGKLNINFNDGTPSVEVDFADLMNIEITDASAPSGMVFVQGGTYEMGLNPTWNDEKPPHFVTLSSFYMGKNHVTQKEWEDIMGTWDYDDGWQGPYGVGDDYPVYLMRWFEVIKYLNLRSIAEELTPVYTINGSTDPADWGAVPTHSGASNIGAWNAVICNWSADGYRLPTEAEWEYAARGGIHWEDGLRYSGVHEYADLPDYAWFQNNSGLSTHPVGSKLPNQLGLYDMSGNLTDYCWDWYSNTYYQECYDQGTVIDPKGPAVSSESPAKRSSKGGFFNSEEFELRVSYRKALFPYLRYRLSGLRVVRNH